MRGGEERPEIRAKRIAAFVASQHAKQIEGVNYDALSCKMTPQLTIWFEPDGQLFTIVQRPEDSQAPVG